MHAFPKDSLNNSIGGSGPLNAQADHSTIMGNATEEAFRDYARGAKFKNGYAYPASSQKDPQIFDASSRGAVVHGDETHGLGTSTFLEGTPAAKTAIARRQAEQAQDSSEGGLQRKKSLAQRIRNINRGPRDMSATGRLTSPDGVYNAKSPDAMPAGSSAPTEQSPFFAEFSKGEDKLTIGNRNRALSPTSPPPVPRRSSGASLERRATTDATTPTGEAPSKPSGLLGRMKSLKGGGRRKNSEGNGGAASQATAP